LHIITNNDLIRGDYRMPEAQLVITSIVCLVLLIGLVADYMPAHVLMFVAVSTLMLLGVFTPLQAFAGFANKEMLTVAVLYIVAASFNTCGLTGYLGDIMMGTSRNSRRALTRMMIISASISVFFNNTPIVAILAPAVVEWCRKNNVPPSKLLIPLSYAVLFGGLGSLIGTSTNLVVNGLMERAHIGGMSFFEIGYIGIPMAIIGILYMLTIGCDLLPNRKNPIDEVQEKTKEFLVNVCLGSDSMLADKTVEETHLRNLPALFFGKNHP